MSIADKLTTITENQQRVYDAGFTAGQESGGGGGSYDQGYADGKQAEYDRFWDACQENGNRTKYSYAFAHGSWKDETFKPKYDIRPVGDASYMFNKCQITDLKGILERQGVVLDLSGVTWSVNTFHEMRENTRVPELDIRNTPDFTFSYNTSLVSIDKLILNEDGTNALSFSYCQSLEYIRFDGVIGKDLNMQHCKNLTNDSVQSIIDHLKDLTGETAKTVRFHATVGANITDAQKAQITAKNWTLVY